MGRHESFESFKPHKDNVRAVQEEKERKTLEVHNENLFDETPDGKINEATGKLIDNSPETDSTDETRDVRKINEKDSSEDIMGSLPDALPDDANELKRWMEKETEKLRKKQAAKKGGSFKKAA